MINSKTIYISILFIFSHHFMYSLQSIVPGIGKRWITAITIDTISTNTMYVGTTSDFSLGITGAIFKTKNGGISWDTLLQNITVRDIDIHPTDSKIIYATLGINGLTVAGVIKSYDGGITWNKSDSGIYYDYEVGPSTLAIDPIHPETLYVGTAGIASGTFYRSVNGGKYWSSLGDSTLLIKGPTAIAVNPESTNVIFAGTNYNGDIMKSTDYGETWNYTGLSDGVTLTIKYGNPSSIVYVGSWTERKCGFFVSSNSGTTWLNIDKGIIDSVFDVRSIGFYGSGNDKKIFITGNTHQWKPRIYFKKESESRWSLLSVDSTLPQFYTIETGDTKIWIGGTAGLYKMDYPLSNHYEGITNSPMYLSLFQNYPNPFNPITSIEYQIPTRDIVTVKVFDLLGKEINVLVNEIQNSGKHNIQFSAKNYSSGFYIYRITHGSNSTSRKMLLLK